MVRILFLFVLIVICTFTVAAQNSSVDPQDNDSRPSRRRSNSDLSSPQQEIFARAAIEREKAAHAENLERARQTAQLSQSLRDYFADHLRLSADEEKKLERIEKLARRIRSNAGGTNADGILENPPGDMKTSLKRLAEISDELRRIIEKTPRQVVSAAVIDRANEILDLIRYLRGMNRQ